jgi:hypothetical protein
MTVVSATDVCVGTWTRMPSSTEKPVVIDANPIPAVSIWPSKSARVKDKSLYVNANDKIVMHGSCSPSAGSSITALQWTVTDMDGQTVDTSNGALFTLGVSSPDFVLLGDSGLLSPGSVVRARPPSFVLCFGLMSVCVFGL